MYIAVVVYRRRSVCELGEDRGIVDASDMGDIFLSSCEIICIKQYTYNVICTLCWHSIRGGGGGRKKGEGGRKGGREEG